VVQVALEAGLHVLGDLHVLVVDLLDLKQARCQTKKEKEKSSSNYTVPIC
jgi:hypothetical protein